MILSIFQDYGNRLQAKNTGERQRRIDRIQQDMSSKFESDLAFFELECILPDKTRTTRRIKVIHRDFIIELNPDRNKSLYFHAHPDEDLPEGSILLDLFKQNWMVTASSNMNEIMDRGVIQQVNWRLKWIFEGAIVDAHAVLSGVSRRSDGVDEKRAMVLPEDAILITVPVNEDTIHLERDMRFIIWGAAFKITKVDRYTHDELIYIIVVEDFVGSNDNLYLSIADYDKYEEPEELVGSYITLEGKTALRLSEPETYVAEVFISDMPTTNVVNYTITNSDLIEYSVVGNELAVIVKNNFSNISKTFTITAEHAGLTIEKIVTIRGLV